LKTNHANKFSAEIDSLVLGMRSSLLPPTPFVVPSYDKNETVADDELLNLDAPEQAEALDDQMLIGAASETLKLQNEESPLVLAAEVAPKLKSLADIEIDLDSIEPSNLPPRVVLEEPKGLKIVLNFAKDRPRPDVTVIVVSTTNEGPESISNYQFEVAVSKVRRFVTVGHGNIFAIPNPTAVQSPLFGTVGLRTARHETIPTASRRNHASAFDRQPYRYTHKYGLYLKILCRQRPRSRSRNM